MDPKVLSAKKYILTAEDKQFYEDNGYVVIKGLIEPAVLGNMRNRFLQYARKEIPKGMTSVIEDLNLMKTCENPEDYVNKINLLNFDEVCMTYSEHPVLLDVLAQIFGEQGVKVLNSMLINKPPGSPWHPPHQDMYHIPLKPFDKVLTTWTAIDDATVDNGCLFVIPGSHKHETLHPQVPIENFIKNYYYRTADVDKVAPEEKRVAVPVEAGDTVIINSLCVHGSYANTSKKYRKAITCVYGAGSTVFGDVTGTVQEPFAVHVSKDLEKRGFGALGFVNYWKFRTKFINCDPCE